MKNIVDPLLEEYARTHTSPSPTLLAELEARTHREMSAPQMLTGPLEGRFLKMMVWALRAKRVLEIGMFTGYGTLNMAEGLPSDGELITLELEPKHIAFAKRFFDQSPHGRKIKVIEGPALTSLKSIEGPFDFIFIDADKENYLHYYEEALRLLAPKGVIAIDNVLWSGLVLEQNQDEETRTIHALNEKLRSDRRVECVLVTVRDGIQLVRKL